jgi:hypothetical protein
MMMTIINHHDDDDDDDGRYQHDDDHDDNKTRNASNLHKKYRRTNYVNHSLTSKGVDIWNKLDTYLKSINSLIVFKNKLKKSLL